MSLRSTQPLTEKSTRSISLGDKGSRCVGLKTLPPSCFACLEIWNPQPPGTLRVSIGIILSYITFCNSNNIPVAN